MAESAAALFPGIPSPRGPLLGREAEVGVLAGMLAGDRPTLVTLTGPGGVGKTRLALGVLQQLAPGFRTVAGVPLAELTDPEPVLPAVARALGLRPDPGRDPVEVIAEAVAGQPTLLLLDNAEHLLAAGPAIAALLAACPDLALVVTSRAPLRLRDEQHLPVAPLGVPGTGASTAAAVAAAPAAALFAHRARLADPGFALTDANAAAVAGVVRRLDGLPLAIELAAAWSATLTPEQLLPRLERALPLLAGGPVDQPERRRTVRGAIAWSHDLLPEPERRLFRRLAVFEGGFTLAGAAVAGDAPSGTADAADPLPPVAALADASLLQPMPSPDGEPRFGMLETVREFALERLEAAGERAAAERARAAHLVAVAESAEPHLAGPDERIWHDRLLAELANLRGAIAWSLAHEPVLALRLGPPLWLFWMRQALAPETEAAMTAALASGAGSPLERSRAHATLASTAALQNKGTLCVEQGRLAVALADAAADRSALARAEWILACGLLPFSDWAAAGEGMDRAIAGWADADSTADLGFRAQARSYRGMVWQAQGATEAAVASYEQALTEARRSGSAFCAALVLDDFATLRLGLGQLDHARALLSESLRLAVDQGEVWPAGHTLLVLALADALSGNPRHAALRLGAGEAALARNGLVMPAVVAARAERARAVATSQLGAGRFAALHAEGAADPTAVLRVALASPPSASPPSPGLSPRERTVAALLVAGRTDREIAEALAISRRTASHHVSSILAKLGAANRTAAVARMRGDRESGVGGQADRSPI